MLFPTLQFLFFFIIVYGLSIPLRRNILVYKYYLLIISLVFYSFWSIKFLGILVAAVVVNYLLLYLLEKKNKKKLILVLGLLVNLIFLGFFKYYNFFVDSLFSFLNSANIQFSFSVLSILAPIGISFYIFRVISHLVDCYKGHVYFPKFLDYAVYVTFFPQIAAGPIMRPMQFYTDLNTTYEHDLNERDVSLKIVSGILKKYTISSFLFAFVQGPFSTPENYSSIDLVIAALAYSCMIYTDFSGYSDLSIAVSNLLGFNPPENFNAPYRSVSLKDFWRRWHISLSTWLKDYLYIPLGGNKGGKISKYRNLFLTMLIGGFWHGAGLNFIIWGALHGIGLSLTHYLSDISRGAREKIQGAKRYIILIFSWFITFTFVTFCWIFFNAKTFDSAKKFISGIFTSSVTQSTLLKPQLIFVIIFVILMNFYNIKFSNLFRRYIYKNNFLYRVAFISLLIYLLLRLGPQEVPPFIYFNF
jgi:D-alanyl-lipoteichoic acid acyltransferase DltB (MBOAT superfamily)